MSKVDEKIAPGDFFDTRNPMALGRGICAVEKVWSRDGQSVYSHSGIITTPGGSTFEALWSLREGHLSDYMGERVFIARWEGMTLPVFFRAYDKLRQEHEGQPYPGWRIFLHTIPPLAKYITWRGKWGVCSEITAKFLYYAHLDTGAFDEAGTPWPRHSSWRGTNPDTLADEWHRWKGYRTVFEGVLTQEILDELRAP